MELYSTKIQLKSGETFLPEEVTQYLDGIIINSYNTGSEMSQVIPYEDITLIKVPLKKFNETFENYIKRHTSEVEKAKEFSKIYTEHFKNKWAWCVYSDIAKRIINTSNIPKHHKNMFLLKLWNPTTFWEDIEDNGLISKTEFKEINSYAKTLRAETEAFRESYNF